MSADQTGVNVLVSSIAQGANEEDMAYALLGARRLYLSQYGWCIPWGELEDQKWKDNRTFQQHGAEFTGALKRHARCTLFPAFWNCLWGLIKPKPGETARWVLVTVKEEDGRVSAVNSRWSDPLEISRVGQISLAAMLEEIRPAAVEWRRAAAQRVECLDEMVRVLAAEDKVLVSAERYRQHRLREAVRACQQGDFHEIALLANLDADAREGLGVSDADLETWKQMAG